MQTKKKCTTAPVKSSRTSLLLKPHRRVFSTQSASTLWKRDKGEAGQALRRAGSAPSLRLGSYSSLDEGAGQRGRRQGRGWNSDPRHPALTASLRLRARRGPVVGKLLGLVFTSSPRPLPPSPPLPTSALLLLPHSFPPPPT